MIPSWNGDGVFTGREPHNTQDTTMAEYGKRSSDAAPSSATKEESRLIKAYADIGKNLSLSEAREKLRKGKLIRNFVLIPLLGLSAIGVFGAMIMPKAPEVVKEPSKEELEKKYTEHCRLTAQLHTAEQGSSMFTWAQGDRPDQAILYFKHPKSGRRWTTLYVCDFYKQIDGEWVKTL